jgi:cellulose synthase/poly-beta-1,6-N-acetylglucosamine synthase-like glycosyltransferase
MAIPIGRVKRIKISLGVTAHNEAANIGQLLQALVGQETTRVEIDEILVVSSGSTDGTDDIVRNWEKRDPRVRLLRQERREGKASAVNLFLGEARNDILVLESADTVPLPNTVELLVLPLTDAHVGMTGARPVPLNPETTLLGGVVRLMWELHHLVALETPKLGEMVAFRKVIGEIPRESAVDEASLEAALRNAGLRLVYVPEAIVYNRAPENLRDFLVQRRRIQAGHLWLQASSGYHVATTRSIRIFRHLRTITPRSPWGLLVSAGAVALEALGRALGCLDFWVLGKNPFVWKMAPSTKNLRCQGHAKLS